MRGCIVTHMMNSTDPDYTNFLGGAENANEYFMRMAKENEDGDDPAVFGASMKFQRPIYLYDATIEGNCRRYPCDDPKDDPFPSQRPAWHLLRTQTGFDEEEVGHFEAILTKVHEEDEESSCGAPPLVDR